MMSDQTLSENDIQDMSEAELLEFALTTESIPFSKQIAGLLRKFRTKGLVSDDTSLQGCSFEARSSGWGQKIRHPGCK